MTKKKASILLILFALLFPIIIVGAYVDDLMQDEEKIKPTVAEKLYLMYIDAEVAAKRMQDYKGE